MKDDDFRDWRNDDAVPRDPGGDEAVDPGEVVEDRVVSGTPQPMGLQPQAISCPNCYHNLTGATIGAQCPECGLVVGAGIAGSLTQKPTSGKAVAALVLGILSIMGCASYGLLSIICGPLAILFAKQARAEVMQNAVSASSQGIATAGFVCGIIGTIMGGLVVLIILGVIVLTAVA